jgi:hypothetical protein
MSETEKLPDRKVAIPLGIGIFLMPYIFSWFTLRKGYSRTARAISLAWLSFLPALALGGTILEAVDPEGVKRRAEEAEQSRLAEKAGQQQSEDPAELVMPNEAASELQGAPAIEEPSAPVVTLPKLAFACGGNGYRNIRIVFDPENKIIYDGTIVNEKADISKSIEIQGKKIHILFGPINGEPRREVLFDLSNNTYEYNGNYYPNGDDTSRACFAKIDAAKRDCAEAENIDQCIEIRHPGVMGKILSGICLSTSSRWINMQCDPIDMDDYQKTLSLVRDYSKR